VSITPDNRPRLLIAGASGQLARRAAEAALAACEPDRLIMVSRSPGALSDFAARGIDVRFGDYAKPESLHAAFSGAERMLLISATDLDQRVSQHCSAIDAAVSSGVRHLIYTSGLAPAPPNPAAVARSHHATEQYLASAGIEFTILRNSLYAEFQVADAQRAINSGALVHNRGHGRIAYVSRDDCAAASAAVLTSEGHVNVTYDITGPETFDASELANLYGDLAGRPIEAVSLDDAAFVERLIGDAGDDDHLKYGAELVASFGRAIREGFMASCTDHAEILTGRPARTLREVLASTGIGHLP
jgi:NAD(P)H dehydrogenase (quinone)